MLANTGPGAPGCSRNISNNGAAGRAWARGSANVSAGWHIGGGKEAALKEGRWVISAVQSHIAQLNAAGRAAATSAGARKLALGDI